MIDKICPICGNKANKLRTSIKNGQYVSERCDKCHASDVIISDYARKYNRERDKEDYRKDTIQRFEGTEINEEFVRAYPKESEAQWGSDILRDYGSKRKQY